MCKTPARFPLSLKSVSGCAEERKWHSGMRTESVPNGDWWLRCGEKGEGSGGTGYSSWACVRMKCVQDGFAKAIQYLLSSSIQY